MFGAKAVAGIGRLPSTVESRSIPIALKRRTKDEEIEKWRRRTARAAADVVTTELVAAVSDALLMYQGRRGSATVPRTCSNRCSRSPTRQGDWPTRARAAAVEPWAALRGRSKRPTRTWRSSCWPTYGPSSRRRIPGGACDRGHCQSRRTRGWPWATFTKDDKPINAHRLSRLLKGFDVRSPAKRRDGDETFRGYSLADFAEPLLGICPLKWNKWNNPITTALNLQKLKWNTRVLFHFQKA